MTDEPLVIAADGSCLSNPGPGGWSWAVSGDCWRAGGHPRTTNNLMELRAVYEALSAVPLHVPLILETDSQYVIGIFTEWLEGWLSNGWRTAGRKPVSNRTAIEQVQAVLEGRSVTWRHVKGHSGHPLNDIVDARARAAATAIRDGRPVQTGNVSGCPDLGGHSGWQ